MREGRWEKVIPPTPISPPWYSSIFTSQRGKGTPLPCLWTLLCSIANNEPHSCFRTVSAVIWGSNSPWIFCTSLKWNAGPDLFLWLHEWRIPAHAFAKWKALHTFVQLVWSMWITGFIYVGFGVQNAERPRRNYATNTSVQYTQPWLCGSAWQSWPWPCLVGNENHTYATGTHG